MYPGSVPAAGTGWIIGSMRSTAGSMADKPVRGTLGPPTLTGSFRPRRTSAPPDRVADGLRSCPDTLWSRSSSSGIPRSSSAVADETSDASVGPATRAASPRSGAAIVAPSAVWGGAVVMADSSWANRVSRPGLVHGVQSGVQGRRMQGVRVGVGAQGFGEGHLREDLPAVRPGGRQTLEHRAVGVAFAVRPGHPLVQTGEVHRLGAARRPGRRFGAPRGACWTSSGVVWRRCVTTIRPPTAPVAASRSRVRTRWPRSSCAISRARPPGCGCRPR